MNYLNIHTDILRSEEYLGAEPIERATWLNLMAWCASQENGGVIEGALNWGDRKWMQVCGITKEEATLVSKLYQYDNQGRLLVSFYPKDKEDEVRIKRERAKANGLKGGRPKKTPDKEQAEEKDESEESKEEKTNVGSENKPTLKSVKEGKGKERKEKERKEKERKDISATTQILWSLAEGWIGISDQDFIDWGELYPAVDIPLTLKQMSEWLKSNPAKAKKKQWRRFATNWLARKQEQGGDLKSNNQNSNSPEKQNQGARSGSIGGREFTVISAHDLPEPETETEMPF